MQRRPESLIPSRNGHSHKRPDLPASIDKLRWIRSLASPQDRQILDMVRDDLAQDLAEGLAIGQPRSDAHRYIRRRMNLECRHFIPRLVRWQLHRVHTGLTRTGSRLGHMTTRSLRPAIGLLACGVALSATWFFWDPSATEGEARTATELQRVQLELETQRGEAENNGSRLESAAALNQQTQRLIAEHLDNQTFFRDVQARYGDSFFLWGRIGLFDEEVAAVYAAAGDTLRADNHTAGAIAAYRQGIEDEDPEALYQYAQWLLEHQEWRAAAHYLERADRQWRHVLGKPDPYGQAVADLHWASYQLWKTEVDPAAGARAWAIESQTVREHLAGTPKTLGCQILFNAACMRMWMVQQQALPPSHEASARWLAQLSLESAGDNAPQIAGMILQDPELAVLRTIPAFQKVLARAREALKASDKRDEEAVEVK